MLNALLNEFKTDPLSWILVTALPPVVGRIEITERPTFKIDVISLFLLFSYESSVIKIREQMFKSAF